LRFFYETVVFSVREVWWPGWKDQNQQQEQRRRTGASAGGRV